MFKVNVYLNLLIKYEFLFHIGMIQYIFQHYFRKIINSLMFKSI